MRKIAFIINPVSGTAAKKNVWQHIEKAFGALPDFEIVIHTTCRAGDGYEQAKQFAADGLDAVVAIGGDGTINEVARGLMHTKTAMGIVPMGSGNGLARHLRIPMNYRKALETVQRFRTQPIDAARINEQLFFCTAGIGFDALIGYLFNNAGRRGLSTYLGFITREFLLYKTQEYIIHVDGQKFKRKAFLVTFANASQWGNNAYVAPLAHSSDGKLDVVVWKSFPRIIAPYMLPRLFAKSIHKSSYVDTFRGKHIIVERPGDDHVHFDGESCSMGATLDIRVLPLALKVLM